MARPKGADKHLRRIKSITGQQSVRNINKALYVGADMIRVEARRLIADGAVQGKGHVASQPGQPPNWDQGDLANGIVTRPSGPLSAEAAATAPHSAPLQFGTSKMAPRPFMDVAADNKRQEIVEKVGGAVSDVIRRTR